MKVIVRQGDVLDENVDVLICTANPTLRMTGGVNGALCFARGGEGVQAELKRYLASRQIMNVEAGSVVRTGPGPLCISDFAAALTPAAKGSFPGIEELRVVLRSSEDVDEVAAIVEGRAI